MGERQGRVNFIRNCVSKLFGLFSNGGAGEGAARKRLAPDCLIVALTTLRRLPVVYRAVERPVVRNIYNQSFNNPVLNKEKRFNIPDSGYFYAVYEVCRNEAVRIEREISSLAQECNAQG